MSDERRRASGRRAASADVSLNELREHAQLFANDAPGALRLLRMRAGDISIEAHWQDDETPGTGDAGSAAAGTAQAGAAQAGAASTRPAWGSPVPGRPAWGGSVPNGSGAGAQAAPGHGASAAVAASPDAYGGADAETAEAHSLVTSPMVGTFYRAPSPGEEPFIDVGDLVEPGRTVGIVEAMKVMNPIAAECSGRVVRILVESGEPVEYGQPLIALGAADSAAPQTDAAS